MKTVEFIAKALKEANINQVFGIPSYVGMKIIDAFDKEGFNIVLNSHEQNAAHMAEGYYYATGNPAILSVAIGPGLTNSITGIANAYTESVPIIIIAATAKSDFIGRNEYHSNSGIGRTLDEDLLMKSCTKEIFRINDISQVESMTYNAIRTAMKGRPGPVFISIPPHIQIQAFDPEEILSLRSYLPAKFNENHLEAKRFIEDEWTKSSKPLILLGKEVKPSQALTELLKENAPYFTTYGSKGAVPKLSNLLGTAWYSNSKHIFEAINECDLILALGEDFTHFSTRNLGGYIQDKRIIQISSYSEEIGRSFSLYRGVVADPNRIIQELRLTKKPWIQRNKRNHRLSTTLSIIRSLAISLPDNSVFFADVGNAGYAAITDLVLKEGQGFYTTGKFGTCGWSVPTAMGYAVANPDKPTFSIVGDLSFNMNSQELINISKLNLKHTVFLFNNSSLQNIAEDQREILGKEVQADIGEIDYKELAHAYGLNYYLLSEAKELEYLSSKIDLEEGNIIEIKVDREDSPLLEE